MLTLASMLLLWRLLHVSQALYNWVSANLITGEPKGVVDIGGSSIQIAYDVGSIPRSTHPKLKQDSPWLPLRAE